MPPQPRNKSNLMDWLKSFHKKPKPLTKMETYLMSVLKDLDARIKALTAAHVSAKAEIASLVKINADKDALIAALEAKSAADEAQMAEWIAAIDGSLDSGGSTGGVLG